MQQIIHILTTAHRRATFAVMAAAISLSATAAEAEVKRIPISTDRVSNLLQHCLLDGGGDHPKPSHIPVMCCATNSEGTKWCVACFAGDEQNPKDCSVTTKVRASVRLRQTPAPSANQAAEAPSSRSGVQTTRRFTTLAPRD